MNNYNNYTDEQMGDIEDLLDNIVKEKGITDIILNMKEDIEIEEEERKELEYSILVDIYEERLLQDRAKDIRIDNRVRRRKERYRKRIIKVLTIVGIGWTIVGLGIGIATLNPIMIGINVLSSLIFCRILRKETR